MNPKDILLTLFIIVIWSFNYVIIKIGLQDISPLLLCASTFFLTSIPAVFFIKRPRAPFIKVIAYGIIMFAMQFAFFISGMNAGIAPGLASLLLQVHVFFTAILAYFIFKEKWHTGTFLGAIIAFSGIGLVAYKLVSSVTLLGFALVIAAALSWSVGNIISKKMGKVDMAALVIWGSLIAWPPLLLLSFFIEGTEKTFYSLSHLNWQGIGTVCYVTYVSTLFGYAAWSWLLHRYPLRIISPFALLIPVLAILTSALILDEPLQDWKILAGALVILGLCMNLVWPKIRGLKI